MRKKRGFESLCTCRGCRCRIGWSKDSANCRSSGIFITSQPSPGLRENGLFFLKNISNRQQISGWEFLVGARGERRKGRLAPDERKATVGQIRSQPRFAEDLLWMDTCRQWKKTTLGVTTTSQWQETERRTCCIKINEEEEQIQNV